MLTIIDDYSRKVWPYFLKHKWQAFSAFKEWKIMIERQTEKKVKILRTDNGMEFCSKQFENYCKSEGIVRHHTVPYTPQQNGVAERMNRTIISRARCMLSNAGLHRRFWVRPLPLLVISSTVHHLFLLIRKLQLRYGLVHLLIIHS